jgi:retinol dehydrogenase-12
LPPWIAFFTSSLVRLVSIPPARGALTSLFLATSPDIPSNVLNGRYFDVGPLAGKFWYGYSWDATEVKLSEEAKNTRLAEQLWDWSLGVMNKAEQRINDHPKTTTSNFEQLDGNLAVT